MTTRKSMKLPVFITLLFIVIIVYLFMNIKQTIVVCKKNQSFDSGVIVRETLTSTIDGKKVRDMVLTKRILFPERYLKKESFLSDMKQSIEYTLNYLGDAVTYEMIEGGILVHIHVSDNQLILLDNIRFVEENGELQIKIDSNTKSRDVIALSVGDNYTDGELMKKLRNKGYVCN